MRYKKYLFVLMLLLSVTWVSVVPAFSDVETPPKIKAKSAIVIDGKTGEILYNKDADAKMEPASTTKIVTCMLALEHLDLEKEVTISGEIEKVGNVIGLKKGEQIKAKDLLYALMVFSANDAAVAIANEVGGNVPDFSKMMDQKAKECGAKNSHFLNPNGLNWAGQEAHLTTAYDLAIITKKAMENPTFRELVATKKYVIPATNKSKARSLSTTNLCMADSQLKVKVNGEKRSIHYDDTIGVKTGLTSTAGDCFVGAIDKNGTELISVVLFSKGKARFADSIALWDYCIEADYDTHELVKQNDRLEKVRIERGAYRNVQSVAEGDAFATIPKGTSAEGLKREFTGKKLKAPIQKGQIVGVVKVYNGSELVSQTNALAATDIEEGGPLSYFGIPDWMAVLVYIGAGLIIAICIILLLLRRKNKAKKDV